MSKEKSPLTKTLKAYLCGNDFVRKSAKAIRMVVEPVAEVAGGIGCLAGAKVMMDSAVNAGGNLGLVVASGSILTAGVASYLLTRVPNTEMCRRLRVALPKAERKVAEMVNKFKDARRPTFTVQVGDGNGNMNIVHQDRPSIAAAARAAFMNNKRVH